MTMSVGPAAKKAVAPSSAPATPGPRLQALSAGDSSLREHERFLSNAAGGTRSR
jgi:hypothetical protein